MSLLHMLLAVRLSLRCVWTRLVQAVVERRRRRMLVVDVAITFLLSGPTEFVVFAVLLGTLPWTFVCLQMLRQVTGTLELFLADLASMYLRLGILLPTCHRPKGLLVIDESFRHRTLHRGGDLVRR